VVGACILTFAIGTNEQVAWIMFRFGAAGSGSGRTRGPIPSTVRRGGSVKVPTPSRPDLLSYEKYSRVFALSGFGCEEHSKALALIGFDCEEHSKAFVLIGFDFFGLQR